MSRETWRVGVQKHWQHSWKASKPSHTIKKYTERQHVNVGFTHDNGAHLFHFFVLFKTIALTTQHNFHQKAIALLNYQMSQINISSRARKMWAVFIIELGAHKHGLYFCSSSEKPSTVFLLFMALTISLQLTPNSAQPGLNTSQNTSLSYCFYKSMHFKAQNHFIPISSYTV